MKWSKQKKIIEDRICDNLKKRISINLTNYRAIHEPESRFWITYDGKEIISISKMQWLNEWVKIRKEYKESNGTENEYDYATNVMQNNGDYYINDILYSLYQYLNLSIDEALTSENFIIKALSMIDKRLGKRRLITMVLDEKEHPLVKKLYKIRCDIEKIDGINC
ncbi:MAG: hypothetical protein Q8900_02145 [Bacillota bacterium]|nr:hypothetical protein [Bacillota bacterium]